MPTFDRLAKQGIIYKPLEADAPKQDEQGDFSRGLEKAMLQIPQTAGGAAALVGDMVGSDGLRDYGMGIYQKNADKIEAITKPTDSLSSVLEGDGNAVDWLQNAAGYTAGQAATALVTGGAGGFIGKQLAARGVGALAARQVATQVAERAAERQVAAKLGERAAAQLVPRAAAAAGNTGMKVGAGAALGGSNLVQEAGSIYPDAVEQAKKEGRELTSEDLARIAGSAVGAAAVDTGMDALLAGRVLSGGRRALTNEAGQVLRNEAGAPIHESMWKALRREAPGMAAKEAATEGVQTGIERYGAGQDLTTAEAIRDYVDSMGVGAVGGGMGGAAAALHAQKVPDVGPLSRAANVGIQQQILQLQYDPQPLMSFPDGSVGTKAEMEQYLLQFPEGEERTRKRRELMGRDPETGKRIQPEPEPEKPFVSSEEAERQNLKAWAGRHDPVPLDQAQAMLNTPAAAAFKDKNLMIVPHPAGKGYTIVPAKWLTMATQAKFGALQKGDEGMLPGPDREAAGGAIRVDGQGEAAPETYGEQVRTNQRQRQDNAEADAMAARRVELGTPAPHGAQGEPALILNPKGEPFKSELSARRRLEAGDLASTHRIAAIPGGWALQSKAAAAADVGGIPTLSDELAPADGIPVLRDRLAPQDDPTIPTLHDKIEGIPTLTDVLAPADGIPVLTDRIDTPKGPKNGPAVPEKNGNDGAGGGAAAAAAGADDAPGSGRAGRAPAPERAPAADAGQPAAAAPVHPAGGTNAEPALTFRGVQYRRTGEGWELSRDGKAWGKIRSAPAIEALNSGQDPNPTGARVTPPAERGTTPAGMRDSRTDTQDVDVEETRHGLQADQADLDAINAGLASGTDPANGKPLNDRRRDELIAEREHLEGATAEASDFLGAHDKAAIDAAAHEAATSPHNDLAEPTQAQKEAGNYKLGHVTVHGLDVSIENPAGSTRRGVSPEGKHWENQLQHHYGYIKRTEGADGDHVDTFIGPNPASGKVFIVDQVDPKTGKFDEHKVVLGADSLEQAREVYHANYEKGWRGGRAIHETDVAGFKDWLAKGDTTKPYGKLNHLDEATAKHARQDEEVRKAAENAERRRAEREAAQPAAEPAKEPGRRFKFGTKGDALKMIDKVNEEWRRLTREHSQWLTGEGRDTKLRDDAPDDVRKEYDAYREARKQAANAYDSPDFRVGTTVNARALKDMIEQHQGGPLKVDQARMEALRNSTEKPAGSIDLYYHDSEDGPLSKLNVEPINDGAERIALAAEQGKGVNVTIDSADSERMHDMLPLAPMAERHAEKFAAGDWAPAHDWGTMTKVRAEQVRKQLQNENPGNEYKLDSISHTYAEIMVRKKPEPTSGGKTPIQEEMERQKANAAAAPADPVAAQQKVHDYNPENARQLLLVACSEDKLEGRHKAIDLYQGKMVYQMLRKWMPADPAARPDVYIISAKHGLIHGDTVIDSYEQRMTAERRQALLEQGVNVADFAGKDFNNVFIAAPGDYTDLAVAYVQQLKKAGFVGPDVVATTTRGAPGIQRSQLGNYLQSLGPAAEAPKKAAKAKTEVAPAPAAEVKQPYLEYNDLVRFVPNEGGAKLRGPDPIEGRVTKIDELPRGAGRHVRVMGNDGRERLLSTDDGQFTKLGTAPADWKPTATGPKPEQISPATFDSWSEQFEFKPVAGGWRLFKDPIDVGLPRHVLMSPHHSVRFDSADQAKAWAKENHSDNIEVTDDPKDAEGAAEPERMTLDQVETLGSKAYAAGEPRDKGHDMKLITDRLAWLRGWDSAKADAEALAAGKVVVPSEFPTKEVSGSYSGISHQGDTRARMDRDGFLQTVQKLYDDAKKVAETPDQLQALDKAIEEFKADYIAQVKRLASVRSSTYSGHIAGRAKLNAKQANTRNDALTKAQDRFAEWERSAAPKVKDAVLAARSADQLAAADQARAEKDAAAAVKAAERQAKNDAFLGKLLDFKKGGEPVEFNGATLVRVSKGANGLPTSITLEGPDLIKGVTDKFAMVPVLYKTVADLQAAVERVRAQPTPAAEVAPTTPQHVEEGEAEPATPEAIAESLEKDATRRGIDYATAKDDLLGKIDTAVEHLKAKWAPVDKLDGPDWVKAAKELREQLPAMVEIDVPGDGSFKVANTIEKLQDFRKRAIASKGFNAPTKPRSDSAGKAMGVSSNNDATLKQLMEDGEQVAAYEFSKVLGKPFRFTPHQKGGVANVYTDAVDVDDMPHGVKGFVGRLYGAKGKPWAFIEETTGSTMGDGSFHATAKEAEAFTRKKLKEVGPEKIEEAKKRIGPMDADALEQAWLAAAEQADQEAADKATRESEVAARQRAHDNEVKAQREAEEAERRATSPVGKLQAAGFTVRGGNESLAIGGVLSINQANAKPSSQNWIEIHLYDRNPPTYRAAIGSARSKPGLTLEQAIEWAQNYYAANDKLNASTKPKALQARDAKVAERKAKEAPAAPVDDREPWEMSLADYTAKRLAAHEYREQLAEDEGAMTMFKNNMERDWHAALNQRSKTHRISDVALDDLVERKGIVPVQSIFRGINEKGIEGYMPPDVRNEPAEPAAAAAPADPTANTTMTVAEHTALMEAAREGRATLEQLRLGYERTASSQFSLKGELSKMLKADLLAMGGPMFAYRNKGEGKPAIVRLLYNDMLEDYTLGTTGSISYVMGGGSSSYDTVKRAAIEKAMAALTPEALQKFAGDVAQARAEHAAKREAIAASLEDPKTLEDYQRVIRAKQAEGATFTEARLSLTPEQRAQFDELVADHNRTNRKEAKAAQAEQRMRAPGEALTATETIKTRHTKKGHDLWQFQLEQRVSNDEFKDLVAKARTLGGDYSSYRGNGAIPGWQFRTPEAAEAFRQLVAGDAAAAQDLAQARRDAFADDKKQTAAERLQEMADTLDGWASESEGSDRKTNTARRARFAAAAEAHAAGQRALAKTMRNIAEAISTGKARFLDRVRQKVQVTLLGTLANGARDAAADHEYPLAKGEHNRWSRPHGYEDRRQAPPTVADMDHAVWPSYTAYRSDLATLGRQLADIDGTKKLGQRILSVADDVSAAYTKFAKANLDKVGTFSTSTGERAVFANKDAAERAIARSGYRGKAIVLQAKRGENVIIMSPSEAQARGLWEGDGDAKISLHADLGAELVEKLGKINRRTQRVDLPYSFEVAHQRRTILSRMNIETPAELRAALREYMAAKVAPAPVDRVKELERAMIGRRKDGLDFFPTPAGVADEMIDAAEIEAGMRVLEPSAGMGHIADQIRAAGVDPDVVEMSPERRELLEAKGYNLVGDDFMELSEAPRGFTFGDLMEAPDGTRGILRGLGGMGSDRVRLVDPTDPKRVLGYYDFSELQGVELLGVGSGYDRIIMNPPFSDRRDAAHVQHAYGLLKPGGRLVAIMGEGVFFGQDARAQAFRNWLEALGGTSEKLEEGSFMDPSLPVNTGVNARMVVVDKPQGDEAPAPADDDLRASTYYSDKTIEVEGKRRPVVDSQGNLLAKDFAGQVEFWRQFDGVVDEQGRPVLADEMRAAPEAVASDMDMKVAGMVRAGESTDAILQAIAEGSSNPEFRELASALRAQGLHSAIVYGRPNGTYAGGVDANMATASYRQSNDTVYLHQSPGAEQNMLHESTHAATLKALQRGGQAAVQIRQLYDHIKDLPNFKDEYGATDVEEFVAEAFSSPRFRQMLADTPAPGVKLSIWQKLLGAIKMLLGRPAVTDNMLERVMSVAPALMEENRRAAALDRFQGGSKVTDPVYHGTTADIEAFAQPVRHLGGEQLAPQGVHFFAKEPAVANAFARSRQKLTGGDPSVHKVHISLRNPIDLRNIDVVRDVLEAVNIDAPGRLSELNAYALLDNPRVVEYLRAKGYDGALLLEPGHNFAGYRKALAQGSMFDSVSDFSHMNEQPAETYAVFSPNQIKSATGNRGTFDKNNPDLRATTNASDRVSGIMAQLGVRKILADRVGDLFASEKTFNSWWHKTVGTQYHKAQVDPHFRRVYDAVQRYLSSVSLLANEAADRAPTLLPKLENLADLKKVPPKREDLAAVSSAVFKGTLVDQRVYTDDELRSMYQLTPQQIKLYREFRAAVDKSLDDMGKTDILRTAGKQYRYMRDAVLGARDVSKAAAVLLEEMEQTMGDDATMEAISQKANNYAQLKKEGYAPLSRFGEHTVYVTGKSGEQLYFGLYESAADAAKAARDMAEIYPDAKIEKGIMSTEGSRLFAGISPDTIDLFAQVTGLNDDPLFQDYYKLVVNNRSALKHLIHRKGVAGYSEDATRVLANFLTSNARAAAKNLHGGEMNEAAEEIPKQKGDVRDEAIRLVDYIQNPVEEAAKVRGLLFANFIGGSIASAMVNMTQPIMMTMPYLAQFGGAAKATKNLAAAMAQAVKADSTIQDEELRTALQVAEHQGVVSPQEIHNLQAEAMRSSRGLTIGGKEVVPAFAARKLALVWGGFFGLAEQFNRKATFIAAYQTAREMTGDQLAKAKVSTPYEFAVKAIAETQGIYNRGNRPDWARGAVGATLMTFKQYSVSYLEFLKRLPPQQRALALAILVVAAGANGLPFADDLDDVLDTIAQALGYNWQSKKAKDRFLTATLGHGAADFIQHGISGVSGIPLDLSMRMGMQNLLPATGIFLKQNTDKSAQVAEFAGAAGSMAQRIFKAGDAALHGDVVGAAGAISPTAIANLAKGLDMLQTGTYRDGRGRKVVDASPLDAAVKMIGFQPSKVALEQDKLGMARDTIAVAKVTETQIADEWARGVYEKDPAAAVKARQAINDWNEKNPESRITITMPQVLKRVKEMRTAKADRVVHTAPKAMRAGLREDLKD